LAGARVYHLLVHAPAYVRHGSWSALWDRRRGGWSVFGALLTFVPVSVAAAALLRLSPAVFWDHLGVGVLAGGFWIRLGCVFNGCCAGRPTRTRFALWLHDTHGTRTWRVPVQFLEMAWWALGLGAFLWLVMQAWRS
jgi:phosphatidylglycerol---prolipoprotein diacylglyceryl transferase